LPPSLIHPSHPPRDSVSDSGWIAPLSMARSPAASRTRISIWLCGCQTGHAIAPPASSSSLSAGRSAIVTRKPDPLRRSVRCRWRFVDSYPGGQSA